MSEIAIALDLIYEDEDTSEAATLDGIEVRIRVQSRTGDISPFSAQFQADGLLVYLRRSEILAAPEREAVLVRVATAETYVIQAARPHGRFEWRLDCARGDGP